MAKQRLTRCPKDLIKLLTISDRTAYRYWKEMRKALKKEPQHIVMDRDLSIYFNIPIEEVRAILNDKS